MKKLILILMFLLLPSCTIIDIATSFGGIMYHAIQLEKKVNKAESICNKQCKSDDKLSDKWCECMQPCMDSEDIQVLFKRYTGKNARYEWDKFALTIKEDGLFNIKVKECEDKSANN